MILQNGGAVLFDMDGTVLNTGEDLTDAVNHVLTAHGFPKKDGKAVAAALGNGAARLLAECLPEGSDTPDFAALLAEYRAYYEAHSCIKTAPYAGIPALLDELLDAGYRVAIVSNKPHEAAVQLTQRFFPGIPTLGEQSGIPRKPAPDMVYNALRLLNAERCVYVGDSEVDVATAANAGMPLAAVSWGFRSREALLHAGAVHVADTVAQLQKLLLDK